MMTVKFWERVPEYSTYTECHALTGDNLFDFTLHPRRLWSENSFLREPRMLEFRCFFDDWLPHSLIEPLSVRERNISRYEIRLFRDSESIFHGYIDVGQIEIDYLGKTVLVRAWDTLYLLETYGDLEMLYTLTYGYTLSQIVNLYLAAINERLGSGVCSYAPVGILESLPATEPLILFETDVTAELEGTDDPPDVTETYTVYWDMSDEAQFVSGIRAIGVNRIQFIAWYRRIFQASETIFGSGVFTGVLRVKEEIVIQCREMVGLCLGEMKELHEISEWFNGNGYHVDDAWQSLLPKVNRFMASHSLLDPYHYTQTVTTVNGTFTLNTEDPMAITCGYTGNIVAPRIFPGEGYIDYDFPEEKKVAHLDVLKAALFYYNATLIPNGVGYLQVVGRDGEQTREFSVPEGNILSQSLRLYPIEDVPVEVLDILSGDATPIKGVFGEFYKSRMLFRREITLVLFGGLPGGDPGLLSQFTFDGWTYRVIESGEDPVENTFTIRGLG